jgi:hypothetical protein
MRHCNFQKNAIGDGCASSSRKVPGDTAIVPQEWGFGLCFQDKFWMEGITTSPCVTFNAPSLSDEHQDGSEFKLINQEVWALTPCLCVKTRRSKNGIPESISAAEQVLRSFVAL